MPFQEDSSVKNLYIEVTDKEGEGRVIWTVNERPSESVWNEGQVEVRAHGESEFMVRRFLISIGISNRVGRS